MMKEVFILNHVCALILFITIIVICARNNGRLTTSSAILSVLLGIEVVLIIIGWILLILK